jgi:hypothetical protein
VEVVQVSLLSTACKIEEPEICMANIGEVKKRRIHMAMTMMKIVSQTTVGKAAMANARKNVMKKEAMEAEMMILVALTNALCRS